MRIGRGLPIYYMPDGAPAGAAAGALSGGTTPPAGQQPASTAGQAGSWYESAGVEATHHEWLRAKGFADMNTALASHRSLETLLGRNRLVEPTGQDDKAAYDAIYNKLGRPDGPDKYKLPEGIEFKDEGWKKLLPHLHEAGLSQSGFEKVSAEYHKIGSEMQQAQEAERLQRETTQIAELEREWGGQKAANEDLAARAFRSLGLPAETLAKLEGALGYRDTMKLFHGIGKTMSEDQLAPATGGGAPGSATSVEASRAKITSLMADRTFMERYQSPNPGIRSKAIEEMEYWQKLANPEPKRG